NEFMKELDDELWKLGISAHTKHNEVAPAQHELAPIFAQSNRAIDENLLTMEKMRLLASHHGLVCLQHEKPFEGVNGSGKHNNWSVSADNRNLLDPGDSPMDNLRFLVFLAGVIQAVDEYQELLRMSVASAGNDHRLGANEAPPAIVSIFLGDELGRVVDALIEHNDDYKTRQKEAMDLGVAVLPNFPKDNTDRNRTSPFAFTGNKFEFRMPGSEVNLSDCNTILNTAVAKSLKEFADAMESVPEGEFHNAAYEYIRQTLADHQRIIFNGDGYGEEWEIEAARRGLANHRTTPDALRCMTQQKTFDLFAEFGVLNEAEVLSRYEVKLDKYNKLLNIESNVMIRQSRRMYMPDINNYCGELAGEIYRVEAIAGEGAVKNQKALLKQLTDGLNAAYDATNKLEEEHEMAKAIENNQEQASYYAANVIPAMEALRAIIDELECICDHDYWPVPTYNDILFYA
ncbi:MAG: glutamine synthetase type III, partial [Coriobacteriaceae bacterium]|nr:glutamine synthetase type III [Coriobacteriaceae bacterium]